MTDPSAATPAGGSVIHDLGYRPYTGPRLGAGAIARALTLTGFRNAFGLGRSGKSKVLPFVLLALNLMPAVIVGGVLAFAGLDELPIGYAEYASTTQVLVGIFVAAQAPVLFSRDLGTAPSRSTWRDRCGRAPTRCRGGPPCSARRWSSCCCRSSSSTSSPCSVSSTSASRPVRPASRWGSRCCWPSRSPGSPGSSRRGPPVAASPWWPRSPCSSSPTASSPPSRASRAKRAGRRSARSPACSPRTRSTAG